MSPVTEPKNQSLAQKLRNLTPFLIDKPHILFIDRDQTPLQSVELFTELVPNTHVTRVHVKMDDPNQNFRFDLEKHSADFRIAGPNGVESTDLIITLIVGQLFCSLKGTKLPTLYFISNDAAFRTLCVISKNLGFDTHLFKWTTHGLEKAA